VDYPSREKELSIVQKRYPNIEAKLANQLVFFIQNLRTKKLQKVPGISETLDWALSLMVLGYQTLDTEAVKRTFGCILKSSDDIRNLREEGFSGLIL
jgi:MoxR-like ATPase